MIRTNVIRETVVSGLKSYCGVSVIRANQNAPPPKHPYLVYTITVLDAEYNGSYGEYEDGVLRKPTTQTWSLSAVADTNEDSVALIGKAKDWLERAGKSYLDQEGVICQKCTSITNRDNFLSVEYEYKNGFDAVFWALTEISPEESEERIETVDLFYEIDDEDLPPDSRTGDVHVKRAEQKNASDYESLDNLPQINGVTLKGNKTAEDLLLQGLTAELSTAEVIGIWNTIM